VNNSGTPNPEGSIEKKKPESSVKIIEEKREEMPVHFLPDIRGMYGEEVYKIRTVHYQRKFNQFIQNQQIPTLFSLYEKIIDNKTDLNKQIDFYEHRKKTIEEEIEIESKKIITRSSAKKKMMPNKHKRWLTTIVQ